MFTLCDKETGKALQYDHPVYEDALIDLNGNVYAVFNDSEDGKLIRIDLNDKYVVTLKG